MARKAKTRNNRRMTISAKARLRLDKNRWITQRNEATLLNVASEELFLPANPEDPPFLQVSTRSIPGLMLNVLSSYKDSTNTPNYRALVKSGGDLPTTNLLRQSESRGPAQVAISNFVLRPDGSYSKDSIIGTVNDSFILFNSYVLGIKAEAEEMCGSKLVDKIANRAFSTGVFLGELGETANTISTTARGLYRSYAALRRGDVGTAATVLTDLSSGKFDFRKAADYSRYQRLHKDHSWLRAMEDLWMTWRYGYRLIIKDVEEAITGYEKLVVDPVNGASLGRDKNHLRVVRTERRNRTRVVSQQTSIEGKILNGELSESVELSVTCGGVYRVSSPSVRTANQLGLLNAAEIAWNLAPWTFVIDWFIPVGKWLQQRDFDSGLTFVRGWKTVRIKHSISGSTSVAPPGATWSGQVFYPENLGRSFHRTSYTPTGAALAVSNGIPDSTGKIVARALDAISLLHGARRSRETPPQGRKPGGFDYFDS